MSRFQNVVEILGEGALVTCDLEGREHTVSLLAYEGPPVAIDDWLVVHSGFALAQADRAEAAEAADLLAAAAEERVRGRGATIGRT
jgi:hydrogenase maturation factor